MAVEIVPWHKIPDPNAKNTEGTETVIKYNKTKEEIKEEAKNDRPGRKE
jgi:hypothetical protein